MKASLDNNKIVKIGVSKVGLSTTFKASVYKNFNNSYCIASHKACVEVIGNVQMVEFCDMLKPKSKRRYKEFKTFKGLINHIEKTYNLNYEKQI